VRPPSILDTVVAARGGLGPAKSYPYSLDQLPVQGIDDPAMTVWDARDRLLTTKVILEALLNAPFGLTAELRQRIEDIRFHVINGLGFIDAFRRMGYNVRQGYAEVEGLIPALEGHQAAIRRARGIWRAWLLDAHAQKDLGEYLPNPSVGSGRYLGFGEPELVATGGMSYAPPSGWALDEGPILITAETQPRFAYGPLDNCGLRSIAVNVGVAGAEDYAPPLGWYGALIRNLTDNSTDVVWISPSGQATSLNDCKNVGTGMPTATSTARVKVGLPWWAWVLGGVAVYCLARGEKHGK
jgi:hypothetical protein